METKEKNHALDQAKAQFESIKEMILNLREAREKEDDSLIEECQQRIFDDPLSLEVRQDWHTLDQEGELSEYRLLLCWGGPAVQIVGELNEYKEPESARIQYQGWFTGWSDYRLESEEDQEILLDYCRQFYFGE